MRIVRLIASLFGLGANGGMSVFKIAWRSIQHRGFGSFLTVLSMALGVMMVVSVLTIHGVVEKSFKNNNSFGYNVIVGARGGSMQLTMNTVYYLSKPVENIPYEYYLAFCDKETRQREIKNSIAYTAIEHEIESAFSDNPVPGGGIGSAILTDINRSTFLAGQESRLRLNRDGIFKAFTHMAIPICLGDYWEVPGTDLNFRCVGTKPEFFTELVIDLDSEEHFEFSEGRCFLDWNTKDPTIGPHECVVGALVGKRGKVKIGDQIYPTHGDPNSAGAHIHNTPFTVVGIVAPTGTPHDRVVFLNMEGFFLMEGHVKPVEDDGMLKVNVNADDEDDEIPDFDEDSSLNDDGEIEDLAPIDDDEQRRLDDEAVAKLREGMSGDNSVDTSPVEGLSDEARSALNHERLAIERREVTALLVRTSLRDEPGTLGMFLPILINRGDLESTLDWTPYRPIKAQTSAQGVNPVGEVNNLFALFVDPTKWILLALTIMICIVSAISILVGIYNSHESAQT